MNREVRDRAVLPLAIPVGAVAVILVVVLLFSRVLLEVPKEMAVAVAMMAAVNILGGAAVIAARPRLKSPELMLLAGVTLVPLLVGGVVAFGILGVQTEGKGRPKGPPAQEIEVSAANTAFDKAEIKVSAGSPIVINFDNRDSMPHNVAIYPSSEDAQARQNPLFEGEIFEGPASRQYKVGTLEPGTYYFQCDVHPTMNGSFVVEEGGPPEGEEQPAEVEIAADNIAFDKSEIELPAGITSTIVVRNEEEVPHNLAIYESRDSAADVQSALARTDIFQGPDTRNLSFEPPGSGEYYFQCDVHAAQMNGTVKVG
ncbi:MAG: cupredoxin domain-containing protein [Actinomycetota bacterium]